MASKALTTSTFIEKLLAPLPEGVEPAADRKFLRQLGKDANDIWFAQMLKTRRAQHARYAHENACSEEALRPYIKVIDAQMRIPAPHRTALNWKLKARKLGGGRPEWDAQIARDEEWLSFIAAR